MKNTSPNVPAYQRKQSLAKKSAPKTRKRRITRRTRPEPITELHIPTITDKPMNVFEPPLKISSGTREMKIIGNCEGYYEKIDVAILKLTTSLMVGDIIIFEKDGGLFEQKVTSMQINREDVPIAHAGDDIGLKTSMAPKVGGSVYKII